jgi:GH24 family phage-related lysozyme (muramidase)
MLFGGSGAIAATGQKVFGKGYQAIQRGGSTTKAMSENLSTGTQSIALDQLLISSQKQETQLAIIAKNTMNSNAMARDMNVMRQNIMKLVTMGGGKASRGADMFFKEAAAREASYESQFKKDGVKKETTPTPVAEKSKSGGMLAMFGGIATAIVGTIRGALGGIPELLKNIFSVDNLLKVFGIAGNVISGFAKLLPMLISPAFLGIIAAIAGATWLMKWLNSKNDEANTPEKIQGRIEDNSGSTARKVASESASTRLDQGLRDLAAGNYSDETVQRYTGGKQLPSGEIVGGIKTQKELQDAIKIADSQGKKRITIDGPSAAEQAKNIRLGSSPVVAAANDPKEPITNTPTKVGEVSENLVNFVKKKEGFRPRAYWDHKQWSIGYGTKSTEGEIINEQEADKRLREVLQKSQDDVLAHARKNNYDFNQNQVDALTSFVYNLGPGILNQLTGKGSRSIEEIAAKIPEYNKASGKIEPGLQKRRAEEYAMFSSPGSNNGSNLTQGSSALAAMTRDMNVAQAPNVVVNAPQTNVASGKAPSAPVASATNVDALELFFKYVM